MNNLNYLSSGELAELVGVSRQIIRHYEQKEILTPAYIDSNGYHYYKPEAYFTLEVVISMRKLDVPLSAIKEFLENRTIETLGAFYWDYLEKLKIIQEQIDIHKNYFQRRLLRLEESKNIPLNTVMIVPTFEYDIICSEDIPIHASLKKRLAALAKFLRPLLKQKEYKDYLFGYLVSLDDITTNKEDAHYHAIINSPLPLDEVKGESVHIRGGLMPFCII